MSPKSPDFTLGTDTAFRLGPNQTDTIGFTDSIPHSFGIDLMEVALNCVPADGLDKQGAGSRLAVLGERI